MDALICPHPNRTITEYCDRHGLALNPPAASWDWDHAIIASGNVIFRRDCPNLISEVNGHLAMLDIGSLTEGAVRYDKSLIIRPLKADPNDKVKIVRLDARLNWTRQLPWGRRHHAWVINYGEGPVDLADEAFFLSPYAQYPQDRTADFQHPLWVGRDLEQSFSCDLEISRDDVYGMKDMKFAPGSVVLDIGANVGSFSINLAKAHPHIRILAFEPLKENFNNLVHNLAANQIANVEAHNIAVTADGRDVYVHSESDMTSVALIYSGRQVKNGAATIKYVNRAPSLTLDQILDMVGDVAFAKVDCEGAEYEILYGFKSFDRISRMALEAHWNMQGPRQDPASLRAFLDEKMSGRYLMTECN